MELISKVGLRSDVDKKQPRRHENNKPGAAATVGNRRIILNYTPWPQDPFYTQKPRKLDGQPETLRRRRRTAKRLHLAQL